MDMQDKDFDKLLSSKFEAFEAEPSPRVWEDIAGELNGKKATRPLATYLSIAAGIAVVFTAGWLWFNKDIRTNEKHHNYANLVTRDREIDTNTVTPVPVAKQPEPTVIQRASQNKVSESNVAVSGKHRQKIMVPANQQISTVNKTDNVLKETATPANDSQPVIAQVSTPKNTPVKPAMPDVQLSPKTSDVIAATVTEKPTVMASGERQDTGVESKKHGIHNLGGLINVLVSKVDKRPDKFIEFEDEDDDDAASKITAVNLGLFKLGKH